MQMPDYNGVIETWKVDLITQRAQALGFRRDELPDVLQEVVLTLLEFQYNPQHAGGASEQTVLTNVIDKQLLKMKRSAKRYQMHVERFGQDATEFSPDEVNPCPMDVADAVATLTPKQQAVCQALADGLSTAQIADKWGCGWHTVERIKRRIHQRFEEMGLEGWIKK